MKLSGVGGGEDLAWIIFLDIYKKKERKGQKRIMNPAD